MPKTELKLEKNDERDITYLFLPEHRIKRKFGITVKPVPVHSVIVIIKYQKYFGLRNKAESDFNIMNFAVLFDKSYIKQAENLIGIQFPVS